MDQFVDTAAGAEIYVPLRVLQNGDGAEVLLTLFRQPEWTMSGSPRMPAG